jgi:threonine/homoserine/homoserine lactone efflux protein
MDGINPLLGFALTALIIEITPGPNMTYLAALSLSGGMRHAGIVALAGSLQSMVAASNSRRMVRRLLALALVIIAVWFALATGQ